MLLLGVLHVEKLLNKYQTFASVRLTVTGKCLGITMPDKPKSIVVISVFKHSYFNQKLPAAILLTNSCIFICFTFCRVLLKLLTELE